MTDANSPYAVGYGRPPVHTRFQAGRTGNPGGRPGPAKYLRRRFNLALREALEKDTQDLAAARPTNALCAVARQIALDAVFGRLAAQRLMLDLLDGEVREMEGPGRPEPPLETSSAFIPAPNFGLGLSEWKELIALMEGKKQGTDRKRVRAIYEIFEQELAAAAAEANHAAPPAPDWEIVLGTPIAAACTK